MKNEKRIYALGFFDGVHLGHQALLRECVALAEKLDAGTAAITFDRHPRTLFAREPIPLISTVASRKLLLGRYGIGHVKKYPVIPEVMGMPWRDFLEELVAEGAVGFVCGDDFRFGSRGEGNGRRLADFCRERGLPCVIVPEQAVDGKRISSTYIRRQIECGDMETAKRFLGHPHIVSGVVVPGKQLGRTLGIPTANIRLEEGLVVPRFGVYACRIHLDGRDYAAVTNVGTRPTVSGVGVTVEPWILDFDGDLYGQEITLEFHRFLRPETRFDGLDALKAQIRRDAQATREYFEKSL